MVDGTRKKDQSINKDVIKGLNKLFNLTLNCKMNGRQKEQRDFDELETNIGRHMEH